MDPYKETLPQELDLDIQIEELESKIAPDGGETVLPIGGGRFH